MNTSPMYLRPDVQVDPLIHGWYAWVQLIPPAAAAFHVVERQLKAMKSFVKSPDLHVAALKDPAMRGGPFIDLPVGAVPVVQELVLRMERTIVCQIDFVEGVRRLDALLDDRADGWSLQELYQSIPSVLQGYVELTYDRHHRADFRVFESLLYSSELYEEKAQSVLLAPFQGDNARPFVFSTPRVLSQGIEIRTPFRAEALDSLFSSRTLPCDVSDLQQRLGVDSCNALRFRELFTAEAPPPPQFSTSDKLSVRYFGHACVLVERNGACLLIDPLIPYKSASCDLPRYSYDDLPNYIDQVLITHGHHDHIMLESLLQLRHRIGTIVVGKNVEGSLLDPSLKLMLKQLGFKRVVEVSEFETLDLAVGTVTPVPFLGEHHDLAVGSKLCYHLRSGERTMLFAADSCNFGHGVYERVRKQLGAVEMLFIGMECEGAPVSWVYGPAFTKKPERERDRSRRGRGSDSAEALSLVEALDCSHVYVYAMGSEPWVSYVLDVHYTDESIPIVQSNQLVNKCREQGRHAERLHGAMNIPLPF